MLQPWHVYGNINRWFNVQNFVCTCLYKHGLLRMKYIQRKFISQEIAQNYLCYERLYWIFIFKKIVIKLFMDVIDKSHWNNEINFKSWMKSLLLNALLYYGTWKNLVNVPSFKVTTAFQDECKDETPLEYNRTNSIFVHYTFK